MGACKRSLELPLQHLCIAGAEMQKCRHADMQQAAWHSALCSGSAQPRAAELAWSLLQQGGERTELPDVLTSAGAFLDSLGVDLV